MGTIAQPIIKRIKDNREALEYFEQHTVNEENEKNRNVLLNFPTVYIHNWKDTSDYEVYVGESNNVFQRTRQHYDEANNPNAWQSKLLSNDASLYIIGHEHFNKSLTLDVENKLRT